MENVAVSRRVLKKGNKENAQPANEGKSFVRREKISTAPLQLKSNKKDENMANSGPPKVKTKQADTKATSGEALKKIKTVPRDGKGAAATAVKQRQTHSQAFHTEQAVRNKGMVREAPKPPAAVPSSKYAPGMYKGKIVQSKIGSIWKPSATAGEGDSKPPAQKTENQRIGNVSKVRSKSVADLPDHGTKKPTLTSSRSVSNRPAQVPAINSRPSARAFSARPPARTVPATLTSTSYRNTNMAFTKRSDSQISKPTIPVTNTKVKKAPVSSSVSQYRFTMETAEERRAKLGEWLASKSKTLKRPALTTAAPPKTKVSAKPKTDLRPPSQPATLCKPEPQMDNIYTSDSAAAAPTALCVDRQGAELMAQVQTPVIMNTSLDLLETSDADLLDDPQDGVEDIVVNLCDALEAMSTPSRCNDERSQMEDMYNDQVQDIKQSDEGKKEEVKNETPEAVSKQLEDEQEESNAEESDDSKEETDEEGESDEDVMETTPQVEAASEIKYSVKTTPFLQSVKKSIGDDICASSSRRKSNINDLKFLTPVRRSCRIKRNSSCLPKMLVDQDPCVASLAELVKLDDNPNAYIYRKNPALLVDLPDDASL